MSDTLSQKKPIEIKNCEVKPYRRGDKMEILLKSDSVILESPKEISIPDVDFEDDLPAEITLDALPRKYEFAKVTVNVKVQRLIWKLFVTGKKSWQYILQIAVLQPK